jgi:hypothetical protein
MIAVVSAMSSNTTEGAVDSERGPGSEELVDELGSEPGPPDQRASEESVPGAGEREIPQRIVFDILRNDRRRLLLQYLDEHDGQTTLGDLAEYLAAIENDKPQSQLSSQERKRVYVGLYQCHLPRMDDAGAVDFDSDRGSIEATEHMDMFLDHLPSDDADGEVTRPWPLYYLTIAALGGSLLLADLAGALWAGPVGQYVMLGVVTTVGACALLQLRATSDPDDAA